MHNVTIPEEFQRRIIARRGRLEVFDTLDPSRTAFLTIDMQKAFVDEGAPAETPIARGIIPNINRLAAACRARNIPVIWVKTTFTDNHGEHPWPVFFDHFFTPERARATIAALSAGSPYHDLSAALDARPQDLVVSKNRFSCFTVGASSLDTILRARGVDTIIISGTMTNRCCETTARDAMMLGYKVFFAEDANAASTDEEHVAALVNVATAFGDVRRTDQIIELIERG